VLGASGAATALGDTLFPVQSLAQGLAQDLSPARHFLIALRIYHPIIALCVSFYLVLFARWVIRHFKNQPRVLFHATGLLVLQCLQLLLGVLNVLFLAPVAIQMAHLLCSDLIWINLVLLLAGLLISEGSQNAV
jgi:heme A synthase